MSFAVDTNVLLRSIDDGHVAQPIAQKGLVALRDRGETLSIFPQNLIEFWAVATRPVANNGLGLSVTQAEAEVVNLKALFALLPDTSEIFSEWERSFFNIEYLASRLMTRAWSRRCASITSRTC